MEPHLGHAIHLDTIVQNAEIGGANGHTNARGIGRLLLTISTEGDLNRKRFLSQETVDLIFRVRLGVEILLQEK